MGNRKRFIAAFLLSGIAIGGILAMQLSTDVSTKSRFPTDDIEARDTLLKDFLDEQAYLKSRIVTLRKNIEEAQNSLKTQKETVSLELLDNLKKEVGLSKISGSGVQILLDDSTFAHRETAGITDADLIQAGDIRDVVNVLNAAGAQAVSINGQRIIASSPISSVGTTILVNNSHIAPPFEISAVGDIDSMVQRLKNTPLLTDLSERRKRNNAIFEIFAKNTINIPVYNGDLKDNYINLVEKNEQ